MFKSARWRSEKNKIKAIFKLQFHATQVTQVGIDTLSISIIPSDVQKPTAKLEKAIVREGNCYWDIPVYETVKFDREIKSGKIHDRIYRFVVGTGLSKGGVVGEASINFSNYVEATKISSVILPLKNSKSEILLHVSIQRIQDSEDQRVVEESDTPKSNFQDNTLRAQLSNVEIGETILDNAIEDATFNKKLSENRAFGTRRTSSGSDLTLSSSDSSSSGPDHVNQEPTNVGPEEWLADDSSTTPHEPHNLIDKLKSELSAMARQAEVSELELQTLRKQIVKEGKKGNELSKEVLSLKKERDLLLEKFKSGKVKKNLEIQEGDVKAMIEELKQELSYEKDLNANLRIQLQKTQESNNELILAVRDLDEMLEQKNTEKTENLVKTEKYEEEEDEEQKELEKIVKEHSDVKEIYVMEQRIIDLESEIENFMREKDELEVQMEQIALDYEILKQENHEMSYKLEQSRLQEQLKVQYECTSAFSDVQELELHLQNTENELKKRVNECLKLESHVQELELNLRNTENELKKRENESLKVQDLEFHLQNTKNELKIRENESLELESSVQELESYLENTKNELKLSENESSELKTRVQELELHLQKTEYELKTRENESSKLEIDFQELESHLQNTKNELKKRENEYLELKARIQELESHLQKIEYELKKRENESFSLETRVQELESELQNTKKEYLKLETIVKDLEEDLEKQAQEFETDLETVTFEKIETEKRAIKAEETLRKTRFSNAKTVTRIQEEFRKLSIQMGSTFEVNEKLATKALNEANELKKQVVELKSNLKKKEDLIKSLEKKVKDGVKPVLKSNKSPAVPYGVKEVSNLKEKIRLLEAQIKLKEVALEESTNSFLEKEKDLQSKIEELENNFEILHQNSVSFCENIPEKVQINGNLNTEEIEEVNEMSLLKEKNKLMEEDLKEMQERYSEISLKFAEVEGERQQLVMRVRNLKNARKNG